MRAILAGQAAQRIETIALQNLGLSLRIITVSPSAPFVLSLRRDVDRPLGSEEMARHLAWQEAHRIYSTWFFKPDTYSKDAAYAALQAGDEVGWHICHATNADQGFLDTLRSDLKRQSIGGTHHGGQDSTFWSGRATALALSAHGLAYSERLCDWECHPEYEPDLNLTLTPMALKVESRPEWVASHEQLIRDFRGHLIIESHPDLFSPALAERIVAWRDEGAVLRRLCDHVAAVRSTYHTSGTVAPEGTGRQLTITSAGRCFMEIKIPSKSPFKASVDVLRDTGSDNELDRYVIDMDQAQTVSLTL